MPSSRRHFLKTIPLAASGLAVAPHVRVTSARTPSLRLAHLTDIHLTTSSTSVSGLVKALEVVHDLDPLPDLILQGGDLIMDALDEDKDRVQAYWRTVRDTFDAHARIPVAHCIGNHDVYGWGRRSTRNDPMYGKDWALDEMGLAERFRRFDLGPWSFIVLDSSHHVKGGYTARLDGDQMDWLRQELDRIPAERPVCLISHIPILATCVFFDGDLLNRSNNWEVPGAWMHTDAIELKDLFHRHPNVRLALSGHIHLHDAVEYLDVKYLCNGAVSGAWWGGDYQEFPPGLVVVDLFEDGSSDHRFVAYQQI